MRRMVSIAGMFVAILILVLSVFTSTVVEGANVNENEPNDEIANATPISIGDTISGEISTTDDLDIYSFSVNVPTGQSVKITATLTFNESNDLDLYIIDADYFVLGSSATYSEPEVAVAIIDVSGTYYFAVKGYYSTGQYTLTSDSSPVLTSDGNNQVETAEPVSNGDQKTGTLHIENDPIDIYKITLNYGPPNVDKLTVTFSITSPDNIFWIGLYSPYKELLVEDLVSGYYGLSTNVSVKANMTGEYYIKVRTFEGNGTYTVKITVTQITTDGNDDFDSAEEKQSGDIVNSDLDPANDDTDDYYKIMLNGEGSMVDKLTVNLTVPDSITYFTLTIYDPERNYMTSKTTNSYFSDTGPSIELFIIASISGYYYVRVSSSTDSNTYTLKFTVTQVQNDGNNDFDYAEEKQDGDTVTATVDFEDDPYDYYKVMMTVNGNIHDKLTVNLTVTDNITQFTVYIYDDPEGYPAAYATTNYNSYPGSTAESVEISAVAQATGYFYVVVKANDGHSGSYTLKFTITQIQLDNNNVKENATELNENDQHTEDLDENVDVVDWYKVTVTGATATDKKILIVELNAPQNVDFDLYIYDENENELDSSLFNDPHETVSVVVETSPSTYYIKVEAWSGSGTYTIVTQTTTVTTDDNNDFSNATEVHDGTVINDNLYEDVDEYDYFKIDLTVSNTVGDLLVVNLTVQSEVATVSVTLYDPDQASIKSDKTNYWGEDSSIELRLGASRNGTYYICLKLYNGGIVDYTMKVTVTQYTRDNNDDFANATEVDSIDSIVTDNLDTELDLVDVYKIYMTPSMVYDQKIYLVTNITRSDSQTSSDNEDITVYITIYGPNEEDISSETMYYDEDSEEVVAPIEIEGYYYIKVSASTYTTGTVDYTLRFRTEIMVDDHNDDFANATVVFMGETITGHIDSDFDYNDFYKIMMLEGDILDITIEFTDTDGRYYGYIYPPNASSLYEYIEYNSTYYSESGMITLYYEVDITGYYYIRVYASTYYNTESDYTLSIGGSGNHPALVTLLSPENGAIVHGESVTLEWDASDEDGDTITYDIYLGTSIYSMKCILQSHSQKKLVYSDLEDGKRYFWTVIPFDGLSEGRCLSGIWNFTIRFNEPPVLENITPAEDTVVLDKGQSMLFGINATDPEGNALTFKWYLNDELIEGEDKNIYEFKATFDMGGETYKLKVIVSDGKASVEHTWTIEVKALDAPPNIVVTTTPEDLSNVTIYDTITIDASGTEDEDPLNLTFIWAIDNVQVTDITGPIFQKNLEGGQHTITLTVTDTSGNPSVKEFTVFVKTPQIKISLNVPEKLVAGETYTIEVTVENTGDIEAKNIKIEFMAEGVSVDSDTMALLKPGAKRTLEFNWQPEEDGTYELKVVAYYGSGETRIDVGTSSVIDADVKKKTAGTAGGEGDTTIVFILVAIIVVIVVILVILLMFRKKKHGPSTGKLKTHGSGSVEEEREYNEIFDE